MGDAAAADSSSSNVFWFALVVAIGWSVLYILYWLVRILVLSFGNVFHNAGSDCEPAYPDGKTEVRVDVNRVYYPVSYWTEIGGRPYQEDRLDIRHGSFPRALVNKSEKSSAYNDKCNDSSVEGVFCGGVLPDTSLYGVYDGHGGAKASHYCNNHLLTRLIELAFPSAGDTDSSPSENNKNNLDTDKTVSVKTEHIMEAMTLAFRSVDKSFTTLSETHNLVDGTTAIVAVIHNMQLIVGNAGDSRCILVRRGGQVKAMSDDHKPSREDEERRINDLGGRVIFWGIWRVEGVLAVSRAIGDVPLKPYITAEPELTCYDLRADEDAMFVVLASDGLFDVMTNEEVAQFITRECQRSNFIDFARNLCDEAALLGSQDNVTVQVIDVRKHHGRVKARTSLSQGAAGKYR